jgi:hypothetical protein
MIILSIVEVWRDSLWPSIQGGTEETRSHPSQRSETCSRKLRRVQNRKRIMRSGITHTNGNERRKHDEDRNRRPDPTRSQKINRDIYDDYAMKPGSQKPFFIRAAELLEQMNIDVEKSTENSRLHKNAMINQRWEKYGLVSL